MKPENIDKLLDTEYVGCFKVSIQKEVIDKAKEFLEITKCKPEVYASEKNSVIIEYYKDASNYLVIEISDKHVGMTWNSNKLPHC